MRPRLLFLLLLAVSLHASDRAVIKFDPQVERGSIIEFRAGATLERFRADLAGIDRRAGKSAVDPIRYEYQRVPFGAAIEPLPPEEMAAIARLPYVAAIHPDRQVQAYEVRTAPKTNELVDAALRVNASSLPTHGEGIKVGVIDTGIDYRHSAFGGGIGPSYKVRGGWDFVNKDADPMDDQGHGTHVAGIIAADSAELRGVAPGVTLYAYKVLNGMGQGSQSDIIAALERAVADHLDVVNLSLGAPGTADDIVSQAADHATAAGLVVVIAAGNEGAFDSIGSPGTARTAITVGAIDDEGHVTTFSSRGPAPATLDLKPDVMAPGAAITSARAGSGDGLVAFDGTSMAAPHVTGVAALLVKLHPDWTPAQIKSALITGATPLDASIVERAAGRVDAANAAAQTQFIDGGGISFGLASGTSGTSTIARSLTVKNGAASSHTFEVAAANLPAGITITAVPAAFELGPGESKTVAVSMDVDNAAVPFPSTFALGGAIEIRGEQTVKVPWMVLRATRITAALQGGASFIGAISRDWNGTARLYAPDRVEFFSEPGLNWDILAGQSATDEKGRPAARLVGLEDQIASGDLFVQLTPAMASKQLTFDARDENNAPLREQSFQNGNVTHFASLDIDYLKGERHAEVAFVFGWAVKVYIAPLSPSFTIYPIEQYLDIPGHRAFNVLHEPASGISDSMTFTTTPGAYTHARFRFNEQSAPNALISHCAYQDLHKGQKKAVALLSFCVGNYFSTPVTIDHYTTSDRGPVRSGIGYSTPQMLTGPFRGIDGKIVPGFYEESPYAYRISDGETLSLENDNVFPLAILGSFYGTYSMWVNPGFTGRLGEWRFGLTRDTSWAMINTDGVVRASGTIQPPINGYGPHVFPGEHYVATREGMRIGDVPAKGEVDIRFGPGFSDLVAPTITSMRIVDGIGHLADHVVTMSNAAIEFGAADWAETNELPSLPTKTEATHVSYRVHGTSEWHELQVTVTGADNGSFADLGRLPLGDLYRVNLNEATRTLGAVDVRIEIEDAAGNRTSWTQSPAFVVLPAGRRRAISH